MPLTIKKRNVYTEDCGTVNITLTETDHGCASGRTPLKIKVTKGGKTIWAPKDPLCPSPMTDVTTKKGRASAIDDARSFLEHYRCGVGPIDGSRRRKRRRR